MKNLLCAPLVSSNTLLPKSYKLYAWIIASSSPIFLTLSVCHLICLINSNLTPCPFTNLFDDCCNSTEITQNGYVFLHVFPEAFES
jgi:hypothetical protein